MNTCKSCLVLLAVLAIGCSTSESEPVVDENEVSVDVSYSVLLTHNDLLTESLLNANGEVITQNPANSSFESIEVPQLSYRDGTLLSFYTGGEDCTGTLISVDFGTYVSREFTVFDDLVNCELEVRSITHSANAIYLVYSIPGDGLKGMDYFLRSVDATSAEGTFSEIQLEKVPEQIVFANNRVFILSGDPDEENKYGLVVYDVSSESLIHDINLDFDAQKLFRTIDGNIIVSYPDLHLTINSGTMGITSTVRYNDGQEPKFGYTQAGYFDTQGNLYYPMPTDFSGTEYANIPGVYDFATNTAILYFYENFLTVEEREFEYDIGDTSMVSYDAENHLILIGYQKSSDANKGGLLRVKPIPDPKFIDNIDLEGVPFQVFVD